MSQKDDSAAVMPTDHPRVFYTPINPGSPKSISNSFELSMAKAMAEDIDYGWKVYFTMGQGPKKKVFLATDSKSRVLNLFFHMTHPSEKPNN
jgi:hypothetical protein